MSHLEQTRAAYDIVAESYAQAFPTVCEPALDQALLGFFARSVEGQVLDAGCGEGRGAALLADLGLDVEGVDLSPAVPFSVTAGT